MVLVSGHLELSLRSLQECRDHLQLGFPSPHQFWGHHHSSRCGGEAGEEHSGLDCTNLLVTEPSWEKGVKGLPKGSVLPLFLSLSAESPFIAL